MVTYFLICKPFYLSIVEVKRLRKNNKGKDMWLEEYIIAAASLDSTKGF